MDNYWLDTSTWLYYQWGTPIAASWNLLSTVAGVVGAIDVSVPVAPATVGIALQPTFNPLVYGMTDVTNPAGVAPESEAFAWYPCLFMYANREDDTLNGHSYADAGLFCYDGANTLVASGAVRLRFSSYEQDGVMIVSRERAEGAVESGSTTNPAPFRFIIQLTQPKE